MTSRKQPQQVQYLLQTRQAKTSALSTSYEEITEELINGGFFELLRSPVVHLYLDFDFHTKEEADAADFEGIYCELYDKKMTDFFGAVSIAGYSNDKETAELYGIKFIEWAGKFLSIHAVYYEKYVKAEALESVMKSKHLKEFWGFDGFDASVYNLVAGNQLFRHACSPKYIKKYIIKRDEEGNYESHKLANMADWDKGNKDYFGLISEDLDVKTQLITPEFIEMRGKVIDYKSPLFANLGGYNQDVMKEILNEEIDSIKVKSPEEILKELKLTKEEQEATSCEIGADGLKIIADIINKSAGFCVHWHGDFKSFVFISGLCSVLGYELANHEAFIKKLNYSRMTERAREHYAEILECVEEKQAANRGILINLMKKLNAERYENELKSLFYPAPATVEHPELDKFAPEEEEKLTPAQLFTEFKTTIGDYKDKSRQFKEVEKHRGMLVKCVAISQTGYIVKYKVGESFRYKEITPNELKNQLDGLGFYKKELTKIDPKTGEEKKEMLTLPYKAYEDIRGILRPHLAYFHRTELFSDDEGVLSRYVPPMGEANDELAKKFITFFENRVNNPEALHDLLSSHAYRLRHPSAKIEKCFISYSPEGNSGKTFLASVIDMLYPDLSVLGARENEAKSEFNGLLYDNLNVNFEELENENYRNQFFEIFLKQSTGRKGIVRRMYHDAESAEIKAIVSLNTNSKDLYGLINADSATISRLCILSFKPAISKSEWTEFKKSVGLDDSADNYNKTKNAFAAAFYHYLRHSYEIKADFSPCRYDGDDKYDIIQQLRKNSVKLPGRFVRCLMTQKEFNEDSEETQYTIIKKMSDKKRGVVMFVSTSEINKYWGYYVKDLPKNDVGKYTSQSAIDDLQRLGWEYKKTNTLRGYIINEEKYNEWREEINKATDDEDDELTEIIE